MEENILLKFEEYVKNFDLENVDINRKYFHSIRVMRFAKEIALSLNLNDDEVELATVIGLLHDYGRFEQLKRFNTYDDIASVDHGDLGVELLFDNKDILNFFDKKEQYNTIFCAIKNHNKLSISEDVDADCLEFCRIIRDADKLDIYDLLLNDKIPFEEDSCEISEIVNECFWANKCIDYKDVKNKSDRIVMILATFYDLNYDFSVNYIRSNRIVERLFETIENKEKYRVYFEKIEDFIEKKSSGSVLIKTEKVSLWSKFKGLFRNMFK